MNRGNFKGPAGRIYTSSLRCDRLDTKIKPTKTVKYILSLPKTRKRKCTLRVQRIQWTITQFGELALGVATIKWDCSRKK